MCTLINGAQLTGIARATTLKGAGGLMFRINSSAAAVFVLAGAALFVATQIAWADTYQVILKGTVTLEDGSPPPFSVGVERICSDETGSAPGPITNKKGEWIWRLEVDAFATRSCIIRATHAGYTSTTIDGSNLNITSHATQLTVPPIIISTAGSDPSSINVSEGSLPGKAKGPFEKAMKALDATQFEQAEQDLAAAVAAAPKFVQGWHALGVVDERLHKEKEARDAYSHAIEADPKQLQSYVMLARLCIRTKDWDCAAKTSDSLIKVDTKHAYPEAYLHGAVAKYQLKDLPGAEASVQEAIKLDPRHKRPREEYVLGRILEAKGDMAGAKEHMSKYLELEATPLDGTAVKTHLDGLGKPDNGDPDLEPL
jgi:Tfp pilus assembly protein PilF